MADAGVLRHRRTCGRGSAAHRAAGAAASLTSTRGSFATADSHALAVVKVPYSTRWDGNRKVCLDQGKRVDWVPGTRAQTAVRGVGCRGPHRTVLASLDPVCEGTPRIGIVIGIERAGQTCPIEPEQSDTSFPLRMLLCVAATVREVAFKSLDGLLLRGTLVAPGEVSGSGVVLVHGGGVTREEGGFFTRLAAGLADAGLPNLRFDLRAHGESEGRKEELTLSGAANDVRAASEFLMAETGTEAVGLLAASFGGGLAVLHTARYSGMVERLGLINPALFYKHRFVDGRPERWQNDRLTPDAADALDRDGYLPHSATVWFGRPMLNEVFHVRPDLLLGEIEVPVLILHGTADTFIPVAWSREAAPKFGKGGAELVVVEGMQHGVAMPDDPQYLHPQTQAWQAEWITRFASFMKD